MVPIYDDAGTDSELTEQAERLAGCKRAAGCKLQAAGCKHLQAAS